jgi:hypothetical protein
MNLDGMDYFYIIVSLLCIWDVMRGLGYHRSGDGKGSI